MTGAAPEQAKAAVVMFHGRGATAQSILELATEFPNDGIVYIAPQAGGYAWYPNRFTAPIASNEPWLSAALERVRMEIEALRAAGLALDRIALLGFSQGACLALEYAARHPQRYGALVALSGGLIGELGTPLKYAHEGEGLLAQTPVFLGCSDVDAHIPVERVHESAGIMARLGGAVTTRIYPGMAHTVNEDELAFVGGLLAGLAAGAP